MAEPAPSTLNREVFENAYAQKAPWDIGRPQPVVEAEADTIVGSVLDVGCGPGDNALFFAARGNSVTGCDFLEQPIEAAKKKAAERGLAARFVVKDALKLDEWDERFDNAIDSGLFHVFSDADRLRYVRGLGTVVKPGGKLLLLCFSEHTPGNAGPRRVTQKELRDAFAQGWEIQSIKPAEFETRVERRDMFEGKNPKGWFMIAKRSA